MRDSRSNRASMELHFGFQSEIHASPHNARVLWTAAIACGVFIEAVISASVRNHEMNSCVALLLVLQMGATAPEYAIVNYLNREVNLKLMVGFRSDFLDDKKGQRTGLASKYTENTLHATQYIGTTVLFRPELRSDHSWDLRGYNNGKKPKSAFLRYGCNLQILTLLCERY